MSRDEALDDFLARSADVLENWHGSDDSMSVASGSVGGTYGDALLPRGVLNFQVFGDQARREMERPVGGMVPPVDCIDRLSIAFDVPRELLPTDDLMFPEIRIRAQTEAFARAVDDTLFRQAAIDVAERVPDSVMQMRSKDHAVEQVLRAVVAAGWTPPQRSEDEVPPG